MRLGRFLLRSVDGVGDWALGIQTRSFMSAETLGYSSPEHNDYAAVPYLELRRIFGGIPDDLKAGAFVDYGCGLGRVLAVASRKGFTRAIGVELSAELVQAGKGNLRNYSNCEIVHCDATTYEVPPDATVFYFANPFGGKTLEDTLRQIARSVRAVPRPHLVVGYNNTRKLPTAAAAADIHLRTIESHYPRIGKVWATWTIE